jgi:hypothetical protein
VIGCWERWLLSSLRHGCQFAQHRKALLACARASLFLEEQFKFHEELKLEKGGFFF